MVGAVATFLAGSPFRYVKCIGELASIAFGAPFLIIHERCLHDEPSITEKPCPLSTPKYESLILRENPARLSHIHPKLPCDNYRD
jgi:hypothetical protein